MSIAAEAALLAFGGAWHASLTAKVQCRPGEKSQLVECLHHGPLRLQKALWPEGDHPVHLLLLHPPGGIAAGDYLSIDFTVEADSHALVTTPGAGKWYRGSRDGHEITAKQELTLTVGANASLEWFPQEVIVHDGALAQSDVQINLNDASSMIGSELLVLGRKAYGEQFASGLFAQHLQLRRGGRLLWSDSSRVEPGLISLSSVLNNFHCTGVLWASAPPKAMAALGEAIEEQLETLGTAQLGTHGVCGVSRIHPELLLMRVAASHPEKARAALSVCWQSLRPALLKRDAHLPRIWRT